MSMTLEQAVNMARAIGMDIQQREILSHDPLQGYNRSSLTRVIGNNAVVLITDNFKKELESALAGSYSNEIHMLRRHSFTVSRGKNKGFQGIVLRHMPSKYDENDTTFVLYDPFKSEEVFCNTKSAKITVWRVGEVSLFDKHRKIGRESTLVRGQQVVRLSDKVKGVVVAAPRERNDSPLSSVGVQWQGQAQESWTFPHLISVE